MNDSVVDDPFKHVAKQLNYVKCGCKNLSQTLLNTSCLDNDDRVQLIDWNLKLNSSLVKDNEIVFNSPDQWNVYTLRNEPRGLLIVKNLFKQSYTKDLYDQLLFDVPTKQRSLLRSNEDLEQLAQLPREKIDRSNLRWITFGYHYDWTEKVQ